MAHFRTGGRDLLSWCPPPDHQDQHGKPEACQHGWVHERIEIHPGEYDPSGKGHGHQGTENETLLSRRRLARFWLDHFEPPEWRTDPVSFAMLMSGVYSSCSNTPSGAPGGLPAPQQPDNPRQGDRRKQSQRPSSLYSSNGLLQHATDVGVANLMMCPDRGSQWSKMRIRRPWRLAALVCKYLQSKKLESCAESREATLTIHGSGIYCLKRGRSCSPGKPRPGLRSARAGICKLRIRL